MAAPSNVARALQRVLDIEILPPSETIRPPGPAALLNPRRLELVLTAAVYPGLHLRSAARLLSSSLDAVRHHAKRLEADGLLRLRRIGRRTVLLVPGQFPRTAEPLLAAWADPKGRQVLEALRSPRPVGRTELLATLGTPSGSLDRTIRRLEQAGAIRIVRGPKGLRVAPSGAWTRLERSARDRSAARLRRFTVLLERQGLRPNVEATDGDRARLNVDGPRGRLRFSLPLNPLASPR